MTVLRAFVGLVGAVFAVAFLVFWLGIADAARSSCRYRAGRALPDPRCTPGMTNPAVEQTAVGIDPPGDRRDNLDETVCKPGWAATVRPSSSYTRRVKREQLAAYAAARGSYQEDHLIPLELGGAPRDPRNLWPQPIGYARAKDRVENALHRLVCDRKIDLWSARGLIAVDWRAAAAFVAWIERSAG